MAFEQKRANERTANEQTGQTRKCGKSSMITECCVEVKFDVDVEKEVRKNAQAKETTKPRKEMK